QCEVGAKCERNHSDHNQEEQRTHQRTAADANGQLHVTDKKGGESIHARSNFSSHARSRPIIPWAAAMIIPPSTRRARISSASRFCDGASSEEVGSSSSQMGRDTASRRAIDNRRR